MTEIPSSRELLDRAHGALQYSLKNSSEPNESDQVQVGVLTSLALSTIALAQEVTKLHDIAGKYVTRVRTK